MYKVTMLYKGEVGATTTARTKEQVDSYLKRMEEHEKCYNLPWMKDISYRIEEI